MSAILTLHICYACLPACPRLRHGGAEVVIFRDNLQRRMRGLAILPPPPGDDTPLFEHVCATVLQQSHLCPVPLEYQARGRGGAARKHCRRAVVVTRCLLRTLP
jgi:hypothetical protein